MDSSSAGGLLEIEANQGNRSRGTKEGRISFLSFQFFNSRVNIQNSRYTVKSVKQ